VHLSEAIDEILDLFENDAAGLRPISIERKLDPGIWVRMDPMHLHQVVWNLALNAAEAIEGPGVVTVRLYSVKPDKACVEIQDTGAGIAPEIQPSIFDPFFTTKPRGTGLGLSIVHSILESYDSWLAIQSRPEAGTTVRFLLPRIALPT
jgi:two-component system sensor histidine kinase PilS (NtrC family)